MSSGQAAYADECGAVRFRAHTKRLEDLGMSKIAGTVEDLEDELSRFERDLAMPPPPREDVPESLPVSRPD